MIDYAELQMYLDTGHLMILPTETVYGIAGLATHKEAIDRIYTVKGRDFKKPLSICVQDLEDAAALAIFCKTSRTLAEAHWPGPLTLVLDARPDVKLDPRTLGHMDGRRTIGLRCPDIYWRAELSGPLALTSANISGEADCVRAEDIPEAWTDHMIAGLLTDEDLSGTASTVLRVVDGVCTVLRQGELVIDLCP